MTPAFPSPVDFDKAVSLLAAGEVCAFATETVYGLGADATSSDALLGIFETKNRPRFNPLIAHCANLETAHRIALFSPLADRLATLWPGPLTLVLPVLPEAGLSDLVTAGLDTVGLRVPAHPLARDLLAAVGKPLAAPSANPSGRLSPTTAEQVLRAYDGRVPVLDGGPCAIGVESTILAVADDAVFQLRAGGTPVAVIEEVIGRTVERAAESAPIRAPGMLKSHYAPSARMRLDATEAREGEVLIGFGPDFPETCNLSPSGDLAEAARNLFSLLHGLDAERPDTIAVAPIPETGLGEAINDRLRRAAAPRE